MISSSNERSLYEDSSNIDFLCQATVEVLQEKNIVYHSECYKYVTNKTLIERLKSRPLVSAQEKKFPEEKPTEHRTSLRSSSVSYDKTLCIICQTKGGRLRKVMCKETGEKMFLTSKGLENNGFFLRMNTIPNAADAIANDVMYHLQCWVVCQRKVTSTPNSVLNENNDSENVQRILADIEIVSHVKSTLEDGSDHTITMNEVNDIYNRLLNNNKNIGNHKTYLKQLLQENITNITFSRPTARNLPEIICHTKTKSEALELWRSKEVDFHAIFECASVVRKDVLMTENWMFTGTFDGFSIPKSLCNLVKWILHGAKHSTSQRRPEEKMKADVDNICQIIMKATKTNRQMNYKPLNESNSTIFKSRLHSETPFAVGLGLHVHKETRSKKIIDCLSELNLSVNYDKILKIETEIANAVTKTIQQNNGVYVPPTIKKGMRVHFAIDNTDFRNDTPDGRLEFHGTGQVIFQKQNDVTSNLTIERSSSGSMKYHQKPFNQVFHCNKPSPPMESFPSFSGVTPIKDLDLYRKSDQHWAICQVLFLKTYFLTLETIK